MRSACASCCFILSFLGVFCYMDFCNTDLSHQTQYRETASHSRIRKLAAYDTRMCSNRDISISQMRESSTGIPQYIVQIVNTCMSGCSPSNIRLHCGWFASAKTVNPTTFKRVSYDECLVNGDSAETTTTTGDGGFRRLLRWILALRFIDLPPNLATKGKEYQEAVCKKNFCFLTGLLHHV